MSHKDSGETLLTFLFGALVGAAIGILFAPKSGKEVRRRIQDLAEDFDEKLDHIGSGVRSKAGHIVDEVREKAGHIVDDIRGQAEHVVGESREKLAAEKERIEAAIRAGKKAYDKKAQE